MTARKEPADAPGGRTLHPSFAEYLAQVPALAAAEKPSLFWQRQLKKIHRGRGVEAVEGLDAASVESLVARAGYGFLDLPAGVDHFREDPAYVKALHTVREAKRWAKQLSPGALGLTKAEWEQLRALMFLRRKSLLAEYEEFLAPIRVRSSMPIIRHFFYKRQIVELIDRHLGGESVDVLEIGAGAGNLALFLAASGRVRSYAIVDLPEMLLHSGYTIQRYMTAASLVFDGIPESPPVEDGPSFSFIPPGRLRDVPSSSFDLCVNINSFMEMDRTVRDNYIAEIYRVARGGGLFFNVNRRQRRLPQEDGTTFDNNPLLYPYDPGDQILLWEEDEFQQTTRAAFDAVPSLAIVRAAIVNEAIAAA